MYIQGTQSKHEADDEFLADPHIQSGNARDWQSKDVQILENTGSGTNIEDDGLIAAFTRNVEAPECFNWGTLKQLKKEESNAMSYKPGKHDPGKYAHPLVREDAEVEYHQGKLGENLGDNVDKLQGPKYLSILILDLLSRIARKV